jgi:hypothetical protein
MIIFQSSGATNRWQRCLGACFPQTLYIQFISDKELTGIFSVSYIGSSKKLHVAHEPQFIHLIVR